MAADARHSKRPGVRAVADGRLTHLISEAIQPSVFGI